MRHSSIRGLPALSLLCALSACLSRPAERAGATIELDAFSGRENPMFALTIAETDTLLNRVAELPAVSMRPLPDGVLGYRGVRVRFEERAASRASELYLADGFVWSIREGSLIAVSRDDAGLESWLHDRARDHGLGSALP